MSWILAGLALFVAVYAILQTHRLRTKARTVSSPPPSSPPPPPPPPPDEAGLRQRLERLEAERKAAREEARTLTAAVAGLEEALLDVRREAETLRGELETAAEGAEAETSANDDAEAPTAEERVRAALVRDGLQEIVLLPDRTEDGRWRVEARRDGVLQKGLARLFPDGRVEARMSAPTRAFP